jgi:hypothetical protein
MLFVVEENTLSVKELALLAACLMLVSCLAYYFTQQIWGDKFLRNVGWLPTDYMPLYPRR